MMNTKSKEYPNHVEVHVKPEIDDHSNVWLYAVYYGDSLMYIGTTTQTIEERKAQQHDDKFHRWLTTIEHDDVDFKRI